MTVDQFVDKYLPDKLRVRRQGAPTGDPEFVVTRAGDELGRYFVGGATGKYRVLLPRGFGRADVLLPDLFDSAAGALKCILQAHKLEGN